MTDSSLFATRPLPAEIEARLAALCATDAGRTLGIVGFGQAGQDMAIRAHRRFGMRIVVFDPRPLPSGTLAAVEARQVDSLDALLPLCDVVSLHCAGGGGNRHLMNAARLGLMKEDAWLVVASDRDVVDEQALARALWFETIGGAVLGGVTGASRIHPDLRDCDNLVLLPSGESRPGEAAGGGFAVLPAAAIGGYAPCDRVA